MANWDTENKRIAALMAGLGGDLLGLKPWATVGFQDLDVAIAVGFPIDITDTDPGTPGSVEEVNRFDYVSEYGLRVRRPSAWRH
jgi:hypothetical protein